jgi:hypothetical protein
MTYPVSGAFKFDVLSRVNGDVPDDMYLVRFESPGINKVVSVGLEIKKKVQSEDIIRHKPSFYSLNKKYYIVTIRNNVVPVLRVEE